MPTPDYITELREVWGHRPLLLPGVSGVVLRGDPGHEQVLLVTAVRQRPLERARRDRGTR